MANFNDLDALLKDFVERDLLGCALQISQKGRLCMKGILGSLIAKGKSRSRTGRCSDRPRCQSCRFIQR